MRHSRILQAIALTGLLLAFCVGCPQSGPPPAEPSGQEPQAQTPTGETATPKPAEQPKPEPPPPPPTVPEVHLTEALRATCLVFVGDMFPQGEEGNLVDLKGNPKALADLEGTKLTVVFFWNRGDTLYSQMAATAALEDLEKDVAEPYADKGVRVVAINVKDPADAAGENVEESGATFPNLSDPEGKFFGQIATQELPRVYLIGEDNKIIWFDIEFSRATRRNLLQAIQVTLGEI